MISPNRGDFPHVCVQVPLGHIWGGCVRPGELFTVIGKAPVQVAQAGVADESDRHVIYGNAISGAAYAPLGALPNPLVSGWIYTRA